MKKCKKLTALILAAVMLFSLSVVPASANTDVTDKGQQTLYTVLGKVVDALVNGISAIVIGPRWDKIENYKSENFYPGMSADEFADEAGDNAVWSVGYANASIQDGNELDNNHFVGGSLKVTKKVATEVRDDQKVRTVAISDGRGITIFSSIDAFGFTNKATREVRSRFQKYADEKGLKINSVNVSALHQHSCVDTFGMNGSIFGALFTAQFKNLLGLPTASGINEDFMENLYNVVVNSMKEAVEGMEEGTLYYGSVDVKEYIRDKRDPQVFDPELHRLRFDPADETSKETWIVEGAIHCVGNGAAGTVVTGDYPYFMEEYVNKEANANLIYIQGAELAISDEYTGITPDPELAEKYGEGYGNIANYGRALGAKLNSISNETEVEPILNVAHKEIFVPVTNSILKFAAKFGLLTNEVLRDGLGLKIASEIGYIEFGKNLAVSIAPGELAPEIAFGGAMTADDPLNWTGDSWDFPALNTCVGGRKMLVFGLTNDQIGYILTDNSWHSIFTENEEIVAAGNKSGSTVTAALIELYKEVKA